MTVSTGAISAALAHELGQPVAALHRRPSEYATSHHIEAVDAVLSDGHTVALILKHAGSASLLAEARRIRPQHLYHDDREIAVYQQMLSGHPIGPPRCYAVGPSGQGCWLLLERVSGVELFQTGDLARWRDAAHWLGVFHDEVGSTLAREFQRDTRFLEFDASYFAQWPQRVRHALRAENPATRRAVDRLLADHSSVVSALTSMPRTFVHGEFYASNVLVSDGASRRVAPVDWEFSGFGPGLLDLAALTMGDWTLTERQLIADAYLEATPASRRWVSSEKEFSHLLKCCQIHICCQWLGWHSDWSPPADHHHDWLGQGIRLVEALA